MICIGSGGHIVQSVKFIEAHHGNKKEVSIYDRNNTQPPTNWQGEPCHTGLSGNLGEKQPTRSLMTSKRPWKPIFIMANTPFNQKDWRGRKQLIEDPRWQGYMCRPEQRQLLTLVLNMVSNSATTCGGFILANVIERWWRRIQNTP